MTQETRIVNPTQHQLSAILVLVSALVLTIGCNKGAETPIGSQKASITTQEARQLAEEAYIFAYSMLENYKTMYAQAVKGF